MRSIIQASEGEGITVGPISEVNQSLSCRLWHKAINPLFLTLRSFGYDRTPLALVM
jgi:hypothetical protein